MCFYNDRLANMSKENKFLLLQNYNTKKGIKKPGKQGKIVAVKETEQLNNRVMFELNSRNDFTEK